MANKIRSVLFLSSWYPNKKDPLDGNFVQNHARAVATQLHVTVLFATSLPNLQSNYVVEISSNRNLKEIRVYFQWHQWKFIRLIRTLNAYYIGLKKTPTFDLIHANIFFNSGILATIIGVWKSLPVVVSEHSSWFNTAEKIPFWKKTILKIFQKKISYFLPVSNSLGLKLQDLGIDNHKIIPVTNVIDTSIFCFKELSPNPKPIFLHVSNFKEHHKNITGILNTLYRLDKEGFDFLFQFVGDGNIDLLIEKIKMLGITESKIQLHTTKTGHDLAHFYQLADVFVMFSRNENLPCVLLESLCCGTPFIATNVGGISEISNKKGVIIPSEDENALFHAMQTMAQIKDNIDKKAISNNAVKLYGVKAISQEMIRVYNLSAKQN